MKCVIPGANVKVFGKSIHSLSRIGEELYIEPLEHGLALRTVNSSRSAYACFIFAPAFFLHYDDGIAVLQKDNDNRPEDEEDEVVKCKISMKSCLSIFKSLSTLEKTVDKCKIQMKMDDARLIFQLYCKHGIIKTYNLAFIECETLQAVFSKELTPNVLVAQSRLLTDAVMNFQNTQEEISLIMSPEKVCIKNYVEDEPDPKKVIHTQMSLMPDEFDQFQAGVDTEVTFCLKELRAILGFSESANLPISIHFESPGKPIIFCLDSDPSFEGNFVLATLADSSSQVSCSQRSTQAKPPQRNRSVRPNNSTASVSRPSTSKRRLSSEEDEHLSKRQETSTFNINSTDTPAVNRSNGQTQKSLSKSRPSKSAALQAALDDLMNDTEPEVPEMNPAPAAVTATTVTNGNGVSQRDQTQDSPLIAVQNVKLEPDVSGYLDPPADDEVKQQDHDEVKQQGHDEVRRQGHDEVKEEMETEDEDEVPGTPPREQKTQFRSLFFGLSQGSSLPSQKPGPSTSSTHKGPSNMEVLAEDSDDD